MPVTPRHRPHAAAYRALELVAHAGVVVALALWVRSLAEPAVGAAILVAAVTAVLSWRLGGRRVAVGLVAVIAGCAWVAASHRGSVAALLEDGADDSMHSRAAARRLAGAIESAQTDLAEAAASAASGAPLADVLGRLPSGAGVVVYDGDRAVDWGGTMVVAPDRLWERSGVVSTTFHLVQYSVAVREGRRGVATIVTAAFPPADRLRRSLADAVGEAGAVTYSVVSGLEPVEGAEAVAVVGGARLSIVARAPSPAARSAAVDERTRARGALILAFATLVALVAMWRRGTPLRQRLLALAIPAAALVITPLNRLSNVTRLFDAAAYYAPIGGPFTASVGALAISSTLALFAVLAVLRSRAAPRRRWAAAAAVLFVAVATPFVLRDLARGVTLPPQGAGTALWLAWETALALAATSLLTAGVWAGQRALGRGRGLPLWIAPTIAAAVALLGPVILEGSARWPRWYPVLWVVAVAALALGRRSRAVLFSSAIVAACGATTLVWGVTLRERVELATADVRSIGAVDAAATALLERFAVDVAQLPVPADCALLLARYAASDLAVLDAPVVLAHWPADGPPALLSLGGDGRGSELEVVIAEARATHAVTLRSLRAAPAAALALAVPDEAGGVTTVVVGARTQLTPMPAFLELFGLEGAPVRPPYQLIATGAATPADSAYTPWIRRGAHLHADWVLPAGPDRIRIHASVPFDAYDALVPRGVLVVIINVMVVGVLWALYLLADGALARWLRIRRREWVRSYRLRLGFALFAFFVVPALAFAMWSYRRLQADDRAARELLVRETLRRATADTTSAVPGVVNVPPDVPLLVYRGGQLVAASDSLLVALAPAGAFLDGRVRESLAAREELVATAPLLVGERELLFGFRSLAPGLVAAVPARRDDLTLDKRRSDLGVLVILSTLLGAFAALALSGAAARQLARPIGTLRRGALAVAGGSRAPLNAADAPAEFVPVFRAFDRMARDLATSEAQLSRAERVFAWGEMARQVAHEIKNPLTPIRLGVQHLVRAWHDRRPEFGTILEENAERLLREIDHLDATARSFSQYGTAPGEAAALETFDSSLIVRDVAALEAIGADGLDWRVVGPGGPHWVRSRGAELREVLLNLCENSRLAGAHRVELSVASEADRTVIMVRDDGEGMTPEVRAKVFDPHFSTRTSGSGLGLAISRRLVEGWGGTIDFDSVPGEGTTVRVRLRSAKPGEPAPS